MNLGPGDELATEEKPRIAHGGALDEARRLYPCAPEPWIDLSTGVNTIPYPAPDIPAEAWARLPSASEDFELREIAAARYGAVDPVQITAAPGTQALIQILPRLVGQARVAILGPTYAEHGASWRREGHHVYEVETLAKALDGATIIVAVNPNNPTGRVIPAEELRWAARALDRRGGLLVVDEAFMDVIEPCQSVIPALPPSTVVLRSFGKSYGLAGVRLGFAATERKIAERLRDLLGPWAVSGPAIFIGRAALADSAWLAEARLRLGGDAERLDAMLISAGCEVLGGTPLFRLAAHAFAQALADKLGENGILVRRFSEEQTWLRFGIPCGKAAWRRLQEALTASAIGGATHTR